MRKNPFEDLSVKTKIVFRRKPEGRRMDYLVDSGRNLVRLDSILRYFVLVLDLVIFIDKTPSVIG